MLRPTAGRAHEFTLYTVTDFFDFFDSHFILISLTDFFDSHFILYTVTDFFDFIGQNGSDF